jgi:hypothetical protein
VDAALVTRKESFAVVVALQALPWFWPKQRMRFCMIDRLSLPALSTVTRAAFALSVGVLTLVGPVSAASAQGGTDPGPILVTAEEAGRDAVMMKDETGADDRAQWAHRRWERDRDNEDVKTGPVVIDHVVWIARDVATAKAMFNEQSALNEQFPEAADKRVGTFAWKVSGLGDEVNGLSACDDCGADRDYNLHHRLVMRKGLVVSMSYVYGRQSVVPQTLGVWFASKILSRVPDNAVSGIPAATVPVEKTLATTE